MDDLELLRYSRHLLLEEFGLEGQTRVSEAHALVIGLGGLGSPVALYLAAAGVGHISLVDADRVDLSNLQRQIVHGTDDVGRLKIDSAAAAMRRVNPGVQITCHSERADVDWLDRNVPATSVVLDCTDNFATRQVVNAACVRWHVPLVSGSAIRFDGQLMVFDPSDSGSGCYACLFPDEHAPEETRCAVLGVFAPLVGTIGTLQAAEAIKLICRMGPPSINRLTMFNALNGNFDSVRFTRRMRCSVCGSGGTHRRPRESVPAFT